MSFRKMIGRGATTTLGSVCLSVAALLATVGQTQSFAQSTDEPAVTGKIRSFTTAPRGEQDGATLDDGTLAHWPPHLSERITAIVKPGDRVRLTGRTETGPAGDRRFEVSQITNLNSGDSLNVADAPPPRGPAREPRRAQPNVAQDQSARGMVRDFTTAPRGEIDGLILDNGTIVHWPPHRQDEFKGIVNKGDRVLVVGRMETAPRGETHLETAALKNLDTGATRGDVESAQIERESNPTREVSANRIRELENRVERLERQIQELLRQR